MPDAFTTESTQFRQIVCQVERVGLSAAQPLTQFCLKNYTKSLTAEFTKIESESGNKELISLQVGGAYVLKTSL